MSDCKQLLKDLEAVKDRRSQINSGLEKSASYLTELAVLEGLKNIAVRDQDSGTVHAIIHDQVSCLKEYSKLVDDASETGLNNYIEEAMTIALDDKHELDTSYWKCSLSADKVLSEVDNRASSITWLTKSELGLVDNEPVVRDAAAQPCNKRPRTSPPSASIPVFTKPRDSAPKPRDNAPKPRDNAPKPRDNDPKTTSSLPDRLKSRIYPGKLKHVPEEMTGECPFQSATTKYATDCVRSGKALDSNIKKSLGGKNPKVYKPPLASEKEEEWEGDERMRGVDKKLAKLILNEIMDKGISLTWDDISGLQYAKKTIREIVVWPMLRPDIFTGLRGPPKGVLLFGPPGTGKTLIGKCIASQSKSTFFSISASSLTSKWIGEGEKLVRALFAVARCHQPAVIFIDEIDSLLSQRSESEHESSRRIKTEFLIQLDGVSCDSDERLLVVGATNRPQEIDEAARRRLVKRLYIPLPDSPARVEILQKLLKQINNSLTLEHINKIAELTQGYSGADMTSLCRDAALAPIRAITDIEHIDPDQVRSLTYDDMVESTRTVKSSVNESELEMYLNWNRQFGSGV